ncbi:MAG: hypothetical protein ACRD6X_12010 [Pyrinomonadaceae bacterium]|uniref:hypothetical protein n=1 Tax=Pseudomonas sp. TaxID=306 RepID=UPI003D6DD076
MDGSQVTMVVSVVGGVVGLIALTVAWSQMRIASAKTKLDLYNKRFNVYLAALEFHQCAGSGDGIKEKFDKLTQAYRESLFLFYDKDGIRKTLEKIQIAGFAILTHHIAKLDPNSAADLFKEFQTPAGDAYMGMEEDIRALEDQLKSYLSFNNVRGWTFF